MKKILFTIAFVTMQFIYAQKNIISDSTKGKKNKYKPKISGVIQVHHLTQLNTNGDTVRGPNGFRILRARLTAKGKINKFISYKLMIDPRAPEQRGILRDAYLDLDLIKNQTIRVGQQKTQFGWENRESTTELYTVNRAEMSDAISRGESLRDIGIGLLGEIKLSKKIRIENAVTLTNGTRFNVAGPPEFNSKKALWGRIGLRYKHEDWIVRLGGSFGTGGIREVNDLSKRSDDTYFDFNRLGADLQIEHRRFFLAGEFGLGTNKVKGIIEEEPIGYQALLALKTKWKFGPLIRYDSFEDEWKVLTCGAYYGNPNDRYRILLNYVFRGNIKDKPEGEDDRLYLQMQVRF